MFLVGSLTVLYPRASKPSGRNANDSSRTQTIFFLNLFEMISNFKIYIVACLISFRAELDANQAEVI